MGHPQSLRRFQTNPIEMMALALVIGLFVNSLYHLLYDCPDLNCLTFARRTQITSQKTTQRGPASAVAMSPRFVSTLEIPCSPPTQDQIVQAAKVRLNGSFCREIQKAQITNQANQFEATVFLDPEFQRFSTDYIPLNSGKNILRFIFSSSKGETQAYDITVIKMEEQTSAPVSSASNAP